MKAAVTLIGAAACLMLCIGSAVAEIPGYRVDASFLNIVNADSPGAPWYGPRNGWYDNLWNPWPQSGDGTTYGFESWTNRGSGAENSPKIRMSIRGVDPADTYDVYVLYFANPNRPNDYEISAGITGQPMQVFNQDNGFDTGEIVEWVTNMMEIYAAHLGQVTGVNTISIDVDDVPEAYETLFWGFSYAGGDPATPPGDLRVHVDRQNWTLGDLDPRLAPVKIELSKNGTVAQTEIVLLDANNEWVKTGVDAGDWDVTVTAPKWLRKKVTVTVAPEAEVTANVTLLNGDVDGNNTINSADLAATLGGLDKQNDSAPQPQQ